MSAKLITITKPGDYTFTLDKAGSEVVVQGAFSLTHHDTFSLNLVVIHQAPHTSANITIKAAVDGHATANITGKILVEKNAVGTNSFLQENVLLLSPHAKATAIPNLEILCDDVKCSHAATVGKIDPDQLFYLMSRGLSEAAAKSLIAKGYLAL